jgi:hypothetical protein
MDESAHMHDIQEFIVVLRTDGFWFLSQREGHKYTPKMFKLSKCNRMTIVRKATEEHFLMVPLVLWLKYSENWK